IRRASLITVGLELLFNAPTSIFTFTKFVSSASHMMQEHIFVPQSLRSLLGTQSHASFLDRKNRQDLFFTVDSVVYLLLLTWLSARPIVQFISQATFRRHLKAILASMKQSLVTSSRLMKRLSVVELSPEQDQRCHGLTSAAREPFLMRRV
uniref:ABC transmembrane type-1 domain-containing protein n=1 Tax=Macrostomum lignano TaxID=282301 RepID=A0A1I8G0Y4_9PLAT